MNIVGEETVCKRYPAFWSVLLDRGYQGLQNEVWALDLLKRSLGARLTNQPRNYNSNI